MIYMSCLWCGREYEEHSEYASLSGEGVVPRMPCLGLKSGYVEKITNLDLRYRKLAAQQAQAASEEDFD